jgi:hypothetical protein
VTLLGDTSTASTKALPSGGIVEVKNSKVSPLACSNVFCVSIYGSWPLNNSTAIASDSQNVEVMSIMSLQMYLRSVMVLSVFVSTLDKKYNGFPTASMKIGSLMWVNADGVFKTLAVMEVLRVAQMLEML